MRADVVPVLLEALGTCMLPSTVVKATRWDRGDCRLLPWSGVRDSGRCVARPALSPLSGLGNSEALLSQLAWNHMPTQYCRLSRLAHLVTTSSLSVLTRTD